MGGKWRWSESDQRETNHEIEQLNIFNMPKSPLYHYTSREVFWKIIEGESFLARHILFSNDSEENRIGKEKMNEAMRNAGSSLANSEALPFMICFCKKDDLLSQWRGYAKEGIAIEFDFTKGLYGLKDGFSSYYCYTVMNADDDKKYLSEVDETEQLMMGAIVSPYEVIYTGHQEAVDQNIVDRVEAIMKASEERRQQYAVSMIPYIKNERFHEEEEYRLIFDMRQLIAGDDRLLSDKYVYLDVDGIKKPNIRVKFGNQYQAENEKTICVYYSDHELNDQLEKFKERLSKEHNIDIQLKGGRKEYPMGEKEILLSEGKNQERVCFDLRRQLHRMNVKIWCDGHMPIRRIIIGPSRDAELMKASIEEYIKTRYWMKDIKVDISNIPLRT